jgi:DnaK suppressor protein
MTLDATTTDRIRRAIADERTRARERLASLTREFDRIVEATALANTDDEHDVEGATIGFERQQVAALRDEAAARLAALDDADRRLADGTMDRCRRCGAAIPVERLLARPTTTRCVRCADVPR